MKAKTKGRPHAATSANFGDWRYSMKIPPTNITELRTKPLIDIITMRCTKITSLVSRVTKDPVEILSVCSNDKCMIFLNKSFLRSLANPCVTTLAKAPHKIPLRPPRITVRIIFIPTDMIKEISPFNTPLSTMSAIISGWIRSIATSPIMQRGARIQKNQYFFTYFNIILSLLFR